MQADNFEVLFTFDKQLQYQQNFSKYTLSVLILNTEHNSYRHLKTIVPKIKELLKTPLNQGVTIIR